jgi:hypothetical protein
MDEVRAERLMKKFGNKVLLVLIYWWPKEKYKKNPELMPGLEYLVWYNSDICSINEIFLFCVSKITVMLHTTL